MGWCQGCGQDKTRMRQCTRAAVDIEGVAHIRIRLGRESNGQRRTPPVCPSCNVERGNFHHVGCSAEQCPSCRRKLARCGCVSPRASPKSRSA